MNIAGLPNIEKMEHRHLITVEVVMSEHGIAKGNLEYSSITVKKYLLLVADGTGPLKSMLIRSKCWVAFIKGEVFGSENRGFNSAQVLHDFVIFLISSTDAAMFFCFDVMVHSCYTGMTESCM